MDFIPFDGLDRFKKLCASVDAVPQAVKEALPKIVIVPREGLFDIWKRSTDLTINKCIGIGFTYAQAVEFVETRLKTKVNTEDRVVIFYDIVAQENKEGKEPLWNPVQFTKDGGTITERHSRIHWSN